MPASPFIIYSLPRSRTFWLSRFLSYGEWTCGHDELRHARTLDDVKAWLSQPCTGTVETAAAPWWRLARDVRTVVIRRPIEDVVESLVQTGLHFDRSALTATMRRLNGKLDQIEKRVPGVLSVNFYDLAHEDTCAQVFEHCLPYQHDQEWWSRLAAMNLQISLPAMVRYYQAYAAPMAKLAAQAKFKTIDDMARKPTLQPDALVIGTESFDTFYRDSEALFRSHLVATDQHPDAFRHKNIELMRTLDNMGCLQVVTARCNGRVFGYLMTVIGPSLDAPDLTSGIHTTFYASPEFRGLGMKIQRVARDALAARGVNEIIMRAGTRGAGARIGSLYRRIGAEEYGQLYRLELKEV